MMYRSIPIQPVYVIFTCAVVVESACRMLSSPMLQWQVLQNEEAERATAAALPEDGELVLDQSPAQIMSS